MPHVPAHHLHLVPIQEDERKELVRLKKDVPHDDQTSDEKIKIEAMDIDVCTASGVGRYLRRSKLNRVNMLVVRITTYTIRSGSRVSLIDG